MGSITVSGPMDVRLQKRALTGVYVVRDGSKSTANAQKTADASAKAADAIIPLHTPDLQVPIMDLQKG